MVAKKKDTSHGIENGMDLSIGGMLNGLTGLVEKLGELEEKGKVLSRTGEILGSDKEVKGIYGFTIKVGLGEDKIRVEPFGNIRKDEKSGEAVVQEMREPVVDLFEEEDYALLVAEMPGVSAEDVKLEVKDDLLTIHAEKKDKKYHKEILLPGSYSREKMLVSCNNGIVEIKCGK
jgi:HSP20 family protein